MYLQSVISQPEARFIKERLSEKDCANLAGDILKKVDIKLIM